MRSISLLAFSAIAIATCAWSQAGSASSEIRSADRDVEVSGGLSVAGGGATGTDFGFNAGLDFRVHPRVFVVVDFNQIRDSSPSSSNATSETVILFGPRFIAARPSRRTSVFGQFVFGADAFHNAGQAYTYEFNSATNFAFAVEGGLDYAFTRHLSSRLAGGYLHSRLTSSTYSGPVSPAYVPNNRGIFTVDAVYRFGSH